MTIHAEDALRGPCISKILNLALAVPAAKTCCAKSLIPGKNCKIFNFIPTRAAAVCTVVTDEGTIAE